MTDSQAREKGQPPARHFHYVESPIGLVEIGGSACAIDWLVFVDAPRVDSVQPSAEDDLIRAAGQQVQEYFTGQRQTFDLPLSLVGTAFQQRVWRQLLTVSWGTTATYQEIANALENPKAVRAVGAANGQNPISIIVPCHRIIGSNGQLTGYGGGLWRKEWLLRHEGALLL
ncbi:MAG: methylated-DNA--[protein]-cysteine S-methyltransferase [Caldilineaceae bacterium]|nr:methylated-DNA--[protein]-cysteine S-methyltransferase [Caldilineaceae bacterium]